MTDVYNSLLNSGYNNQVSPYGYGPQPGAQGAQQFLPYLLSMLFNNMGQNCGQDPGQCGVPNQCDGVNNNVDCHRHRRHPWGHGRRFMPRHGNFRHGGHHR